MKNKNRIPWRPRKAIWKRKKVPVILKNRTLLSIQEEGGILCVNVGKSANSSAHSAIAKSASFLDVTVRKTQIRKFAW